MIIIGIDPGAKGGLAALNSLHAPLMDSIRMPVMQIHKKNIVDARVASEFLKAWKPDVVCIERVSAMPGQGVSSTFSFGRSFGAIEALAIEHSPRVEHVQPAVWKRYFNLSSSKRASLDAARIRFGDDPKWKVLANDGIAEAALLALYFKECKA